MNKIAMLVVVYNKQLNQSTTLNSIMHFTHRLEHLSIVNNGPAAIDLADSFLAQLQAKHVKVELKNHLENKPLSWIYNEFINQLEHVDYYVLFDDDTEINAEYQQYVFSVKNIDLELPKIISVTDKVQYYPLCGGRVYTVNGMIDNGKNEIFSIGSGLVIAKQLKEKFKQKNIEMFDSRFALYGVDFSFFRKINLFFKHEKLLLSSNVTLNHGLSGAEKTMSAWRARERMFDEVLTIKYYRRYQILRFVKFLFKRMVVLQIGVIIEALQVYFSGKHPRC
jgi:GT2 family glycosyltransferase